jgi:hypothetical protein
LLFMNYRNRLITFLNTGAKIFNFDLRENKISSIKANTQSFKRRNKEINR